MSRATRTGASDTIAYPCIHGPGTTHLDAFAHVFFDGKMWNGYDVDGLVTMDGGALKNSIMTVKNGLVTRGVLYDMPRLKGVPWLEPGTRITVEDLEAWEAQTGVRAGPGDAFFIRWGRVGSGRTPWGRSTPARRRRGLDNNVIPWLKARDVAIAGWETPGYAPQPEGDPVPHRPAQLRADHPRHPDSRPRRLPGPGRGRGERNRWEFMVTIAPLPIPNGTGSPVNPIAMF